MKNMDIFDAYDSMTPSLSQVQRMRSRLQEQLESRPAPETGYTARPVSTRWWSAIPAAVACIVMLVLGGYVLKDSPSPQPELQEQAVSEETTVPLTTEPEPSVPSESIRTELQSPFGPGTYDDYIAWAVERDRNARAEGRDPRSYCAMYDVNADGVEDLLMGDENGSILEVITCLDGNISILFGVGRGCRICQDGSILSGEEGDTYYVIYRLSGQEHFITATVWLDEEQNQWYFFREGAQKKDAITEKNAMEILASYTPMELEMIPISSYPNWH